MEIIQEYLDALQDAKQTSRVKVTRKSKIKRSASQMSTSMARQRGDQLYKMMRKYCDRCKELRDKLHQKYYGRTISKARR